jgi:hypothetical protein
VAFDAAFPLGGFASEFGVAGEDVPQLDKGAHDGHVDPHGTRAGYGRAAVS